MDGELRKAWQEIITAEDYDQHMATVGQAEANALLVRDLIVNSSLPPDGRILFAGAGTGQMFDFVDPEFLATWQVTFTDLNQGYLDKLQLRLSASSVRFVCQVDDIENTSLRGPFDLIVLVLVLEHVKWQRALNQMVGLNTQSFLIVTQQNPPEFSSGVTPGRTLPPSIELASKTAVSHLLDKAELVDFLQSLGFEPVKEDNRPVLDNKIMRGIVFKRAIL